MAIYVVENVSSRRGNRGRVDEEIMVRGRILRAGQLSLPLDSGYIKQHYVTLELARKRFLVEVHRVEDSGKVRIPHDTRLIDVVTRDEELEKEAASQEKVAEPPKVFGGDVVAEESVTVSAIDTVSVQSVENIAPILGVEALLDEPAVAPPIPDEPAVLKKKGGRPKGSKTKAV